MKSHSGDRVEVMGDIKGGQVEVEMLPKCGMMATSKGRRELGGRA